MTRIAKIVIVGGAVSIPVAWFCGVGIGATVFIAQEEMSERKKLKAEEQTAGPKIEKIGSARKRKKTYDEFKSIIDRY